MYSSPSRIIKLKYKSQISVEGGDELSREVRAYGFPIEHKHKLSCLRQELIDSFVEARYMMFIKYAAYHLQQVNLKKTGEKIPTPKAIEEPTEKDNKENEKQDDEKEKEDKMEEDEAKKIVESITDGTKIECKYLLFDSKPLSVILEKMRVFYRYKKK